MPILRLSVLAGPDTGLTRTFRTTPIRLGRGLFNEFLLTDPLVSQRHGEITETNGKLVYRDLRSRHGTEVRADPEGDARFLHNRDASLTEALAVPGQLLLGGTRVLLDWVDDLEVRPEETAHLERSVHETLEQFSRRIHLRDPRIGSLLEVSQKLNGLGSIDEVVRVIGRAVFGAFPGARRLALCVPPGGGTGGSLQPVKILWREGEREGIEGETELLSRSILDRVFQRQQAVLFFRDGASDPSDSMLDSGISALMAAPLVGQHQPMGVLQADTRADGTVFGADDLDVFAALASYAAFAMERLQLQQNLVEMFESVVRMSVKAIDARDPATAGHSERVARAAVLLARAVSESDSAKWSGIHFGRDQLLELRYASLLHDFGKVAVRERVLTKATRMDPHLLDSLRARVSAATSTCREQAWADALDEAPALDAAELRARVDARVERDLRTLREGLDAVERNQSGSPIPEPDQQRIAALKPYRWRDARGELVPVLSDEHESAMQIPRGTLTPDEWSEMRTHVTHSWEFLSQIPWSRSLARVPQIARGHHERMDGSGYPEALDAGDIPIEVRILSISDIFDAITAVDRSYRRAGTTEDAIRILRRDADHGLLDTELVSLFIERVVPRLDRWGTRETLPESP